MVKGEGRRERRPITAVGDLTSSPPPSPASISRAVPGRPAVETSTRRTPCRRRRPRGVGRRRARVAAQRAGRRRGVGVRDRRQARGRRLARRLAAAEEHRDETGVISRRPSRVGLARRRTGARDGRRARRPARRRQSRVGRRRRRLRPRRRRDDAERWLASRSRRRRRCRRAGAGVDAAAVAPPRALGAACRVPLAGDGSGAPARPLPGTSVRRRVVGVGGVVGGGGDYEFNRKLLFRLLVMANSQLAELIQARG